MNNSTIERLSNCSIMMDDWNKSLYFVSNLNKYSKRQTSDHDFYERAYKIKNLLKALPTYANMIDNDICIRCEKEVEDWDHIWICEAIEFRSIGRLGTDRFDESSRRNYYAQFFRTGIYSIMGVIYCNNYLKSSDFSVMDIRVSNFQHNSRVIRGKNILTKVE
ncbi:unnamed protein product [Rhizophagus irregularis]|nr:unnamed protein product [Rhizophagus irregularis]